MFCMFEFGVFGKNISVSWVKLQPHLYYIQFISQAQCIGLVHFHIKLHFFLCLVSGLILWNVWAEWEPEHLISLLLYWGSYNVKTNVFLQHTSFVFLVMQSVFAGTWSVSTSSSAFLSFVFTPAEVCFHHNMPASFVWLLKHFNKEALSF